MFISSVERRRRLVRRHHLPATATDLLEAVQSVAAFHSSDPVTPYLGLRARLADFDVGDLERELFDVRSLWRLHAMRRTLFLVPVQEAPHFLAGASREVAIKERTRLEKWLSDQIPGLEPSVWLEDLTSRILEVMTEQEEWSTRQLTEAIPELGTQIEVGSGKWVTSVSISSRLLFLMAMEGALVRTRPAGTWRSSQYRWALATSWWKTPPLPTDDIAEAQARILELYLAGHGPATLADIRWWTGWRVAEVEAALAAIGARAVSLDDDREGFILAGDSEPDDAIPAVALLPGLDPTPMGWKERDWFLGPEGREVFDTNGNAGPTVWADGRIVGAWSQTPDGSVVYELVDRIDTWTRARLDDEADRLTRWLDGQVISTRFPSPLARRLGQG